jgi:hypothetical protein
MMTTIMMMIEMMMNIMNCTYSTGSKRCNDSSTVQLMFFREKVSDADPNIATCLTPTAIALSKPVVVVVMMMMMMMISMLMMIMDVIMIIT